jgi:hypothetical protein
MLDQLGEWVRVPSIAALTEHAVDVHRSAHCITGQIPVLFLGSGLPEDHWHASDESVDEMPLQGAATIACLWKELGALGPRSRGKL